MTIIDIHTHLLPKVDDSMLKRRRFSAMMGKYREAGIDRIVFSPHIDDPYVDTRRDRIESTFEWAAAKAAKFGITCHLGCEFYVRDQERLDFIPHFGTHVLCETDTSFAPQGYLDTVRRITDSGYRVILAHVERYRFLSFRIGSFLWVKQEGRLVFRRFERHNPLSDIFIFHACKFSNNYPAHNILIIMMTDKRTVFQRNNFFITIINSIIFY